MGTTMGNDNGMWDMLNGTREVDMPLNQQPRQTLVRRLEFFERDRMHDSYLQYYLMPFVRLDHELHAVQ